MPGRSNLKRSFLVKLEIRLWCYKEIFERVVIASSEYRAEDLLHILAPCYSVLYR